MWLKLLQIANLAIRKLAVVSDKAAKNRGDFSLPAVPAVRQYITLDAYLMKRNNVPKWRAEFTAEHLKNAENLLERVNSVLEKAPPGFKFKVTSGWRPAQYNAEIGGALRSRHITCQAVDLADNDHSIGAWLSSRRDLLIQADLAIEDLRYCVCKASNGKILRWVHIQTPPPRSGNRVFIPYPGGPPKL
jgi:hypothetical protein